MGSVNMLPLTIPVVTGLSGWFSHAHRYIGIIQIMVKCCPLGAKDNHPAKAISAIWT